MGKAVSAQDSSSEIFLCVLYVDLLISRCIIIIVNDSNLKSHLCVIFLERLKHVKIYSLIATRYLNYVAAAVTTLLCLLVISLESLICSFANLFPCC